MSNAHIIDIESAFPSIPTQFDANSGSAIPIGNTLDLLGLTVDNGTYATPLFSTASGNTVTYNLQVGTALASAPSDKNDAGLVSFDSSAFSVDSNGYVTLVGGDGPAIDTNTGDDGVGINPDGDGNFNWLGVTVANATHAKPVYFKDSSTANAIDLDVQVGVARTGAPGDKNDAGLVSFDDTSFSVDADGYVTIIGGGGVCIETITGDDSVATGPDGVGNLDLTGLTVANATNAKPVYLNGGTNSQVVEVQVGAAITGAPGDKNDAGLSSYDDTQFAVDADGYVTLVGGANLPAIQTLTGDDSVATGPDANGDIDLQGLAVANATNAKPLYFNGGTNSEVAEIQVGAAITGAPADKNDAGIVSFDDTDFSVDSNGYVTLAGGGAGQTITGDSGGALSPSSGNWNILGGPGVTTSGSGSTLTINSVVYTDEAGSTSVTSDSGSFSTAAITLTLPASPSNGERCEFIASTSDQLVVSAAGTQVIHIGGDSTSAGGTCTNSSQGDALQLIYQSSTDDWYALSVVGVWTLA